MIIDIVESSQVDASPTIVIFAHLMFANRFKIPVFLIHMDFFFN